ncbi:MAG TPA: mannose-6-phosphate isomerase, class I [Streptosporangiaceae bacterium]|nr:mannose-6-phosphate isomerase, class I [Streptosporangiaceae bacterium]
MQRLDNPVRDYSWGSASDIPEFLGRAAEGGPVAELWIGAHPDSPSRVVRDGNSQSLAEVIAARPQAELGPEVASRFGSRLPFLLKVISAARPLSLQVHPDKQRAERAYAAQQQAPGAPRDYTDDNHKPELICALRDGFAGLCGFRAVPDSRHLLASLSVAGLAEISDCLDCANPADGLRNTVTSILTSDSDKASLIAAVQQACERIAAEGGVWGPACAAYAAVAAAYPADPGVLVALLLNYVELAAGEGLFVGAGVPHCYLRGFGAELMASSDNVLRAGLTSKRVNVPELLAVLDFRQEEPAVLCPVPGRAVGPGHDGYEPGAAYLTPVEDFRLSRIDLSDQPVGLPGCGPQILLCIAGTAQLHDGHGGVLVLARGQSAYLSAGDTRISIAGRGTVLRATVGAGPGLSPDVAMAEFGSVGVSGLVATERRGQPR